MTGLGSRKNVRLPHPRCANINTFVSFAYVLRIKTQKLERFKISPVAFPYKGELNFHVSSSGNLHLTSQYRKHKQEDTCEVFLPSFLVSVMIILNAWFIFIHPRTIECSCGVWLSTCLKWITK